MKDPGQLMNAIHPSEVGNHLRSIYEDAFEMLCQGNFKEMRHSQTDTIKLQTEFSILRKSLKTREDFWFLEGRK